jgi:hypothetical protein
MVSLDPDATASRLDQVAAQLGGAPRALECARVLRDGSATLKAGQPIEGEARVRELALAFQDASMIVGAYEALAKSDVVAARERLREALTGDTVVVPETGDDESRNHLWTAFLAACFQQEGLKPRFVDAGPSKHGEMRPDLFVEVERTSLAVEAKRVRSYAKLGRHISKAVKQIAAACDRGEAVAGSIALDISFAIDQHAQAGLWSLTGRSSLPEVRAKLLPEVTRLLKKVAALVAEQPGSQHVAGATVLVLPVVRYADTRQLGLIRYFATSSFDSSNSTEGKTALLGLHQRCFSDR